MFIAFIAGLFLGRIITGLCFDSADRERSQSLTQAEVERILEHDELPYD